ncbi:MAG: response regulator transcription factor [Clostridiales bacterium]|nr:response regulator transcription factor [Clostridiales bacterium]
MKKRKILIVEDEYSINDAISFALNNEGYETISAFTGKEALEKFRELKPDLILLDLMLGDMDGFEICKELSKDVYIIMLTARGELLDKVIGMELGADDYIVKPFEIKELLVRIKAIFRREKQILKERDNIEKKNEENKLIINLMDRSVKKDGEIIPLRRKEFDLLLYLYKNKGIVISRENLLEKVWGYDYEGDTRTVDVHIRRIRDKLKEDKDNSIIETVFGVGYIIR